MRDPYRVGGRGSGVGGRGVGGRGSEGRGSGVGGRRSAVGGPGSGAVGGRGSGVGGRGSGVGGRGSGVGGRGSGVGGRGGRVGRYLVLVPTYAHLHGRTDTQTCKPTINARTRRHKMYAKDKQNNIDIRRIVSEIKSKYRGDARTRTPTNYNLSEQTEFVTKIRYLAVAGRYRSPTH